MVTTLVSGRLQIGFQGHTIERTLWIGRQQSSKVRDRISLRPNLGPSFRDDGEADLVIVKANPSNLTQ